MILLPGYVITEKIFSGVSSIVYCGYREPDKRRVVIKLLADERPTLEEIARFKHEYELLQSLNGEGTVNVYGIERYQNGLALIMEDFGQPLKQILTRKQLTLDEFLTLALKTTEALEKVHQHRIIHKDINPSNILWDAATQQVKIIDFGVATTLSREVAEVHNPQLMQGGTLFYISPEQTRRMNRGIDYRTDYYSLGVTFYQLATGVLPFTSEDVGELIHFHIAKTPKSAYEINPKLPPVVSDIIMKLLAKTVEERYQGTFGLKYDLQKCINQIKKTGSIVSFPICTQDISGQFHISEKIYGREEELTVLTDALQRVCQGTPTEFVLIAGYSGIGKSSLVHELYKPLVEKKGYFVSGKFDQFKQNVPYAALIQAFQELIQQILTESEEKIKLWREHIQNALGPNGQVVVDVIPTLTDIIGEQPRLPKLGPTETKNRFNLVFQDFVHALAQPEHPLVIFLDDLQWADFSSLNLVESILLHYESRYLMIVGAFRDNEVDQSHLLSITLGRLKKAGLPLNTITLAPLQLTHVIQLLMDTLHEDQESVHSLAKICYVRTQGNPFFLTQLLQTLYKDGLIEFNPQSGKWRWEVDRIAEKGITDNVVDLMTKKIRELSSGTQETLKFAACLGNRFDLQTLSIISEQSPKQTALQLWEALRAGLLISTDESYMFSVLSADNPKSNTSYHFLHDRVQQAAASLIEEKQRNMLHLKIGRLLLQYTSKDKISEQVLDIVNHIDQGINLITDPDEKTKMAELNLLAANKARASIAYKSAFNYLKAGMSLLPEDAWNVNYELTLSFYTEAVDVAFLSAETEEMQKYAGIVIQHAKNTLDIVRVYATQLRFLVFQGKATEAMEMSILGLNLLGIKMPRRPNNLHLIWSLLQLKWALRGKSMNDIAQLPDMTNPNYLAAMSMLANLLLASFSINPKLFALGVFKMAQLSTQYGINDRSGAAFAGYSIILCHSFGNYEKGYQFGQLALQLLDRINVDRETIGVKTVIARMLTHLYEHLDVGIPLLLSLFQKGLETGNIEFAGICATDYCFRVFALGKELNEVVKEIEKFTKFTRSMSLEMSYFRESLTLQVALNLLSTAQETQLIGSARDEKVILSQLLEKNDYNSISTIYYYKILLCYLFHDYKQAYQHVMTLEQYNNKIFIGEHQFATLYLYSSLACLAIYRTATKKGQKKILKIIERNQKLLKTWSKHGAMNFLHKYYTVEAEYHHVVLNQFDNAAEYYDKAIELAKQNNYINEEALANERAALFYLSHNKEKVARIYMSDAYYYYLKWGAIAKVTQLEKNYSNLLLNIRKGDRLTFTSTSSSTSGTATETLDLDTVMKAAQAISKEIELSDLLKSMMHIVIENAGAQRGCLLLEKMGQWSIEAEGSIDREQVTVLQSLPINNDILPTSIIQYTIRAKKPLTLDDATHADQFSSDPYIQYNQPKSILCLPLLNQGIVSGILYLENNLATNVFTQNRLELLNLLSGELITAIDNARLYSHLKELNKAYESFVPKEFLSLLEKKNILEVKLGDQVQKEMTVMFCDIVGFTSISEKMTPQEALEFLNSFLQRMEPVISEYKGVIDKYIGDAIMALFPTNPDDALQCAIEMRKELKIYNNELTQSGLNPIDFGIGLNTGVLVLGTVGDKHRMEGTVISDAVNIASHVEHLTRIYETKILITENTYERLKDSKAYSMRMLDKVFVKRRSIPVTIYEVFNNDPEDVIAFKQKTLNAFKHGVMLFQAKKYAEALAVFQKTVLHNHADLPSIFYIKRCQKKLEKRGIKLTNS